MTAKKKASKKVVVMPPQLCITQKEARVLLRGCTDGEVNSTELNRLVHKLEDFLSIKPFKTSR